MGTAGLLLQQQLELDVFTMWHDKRFRDRLNRGECVSIDPGPWEQPAERGVPASGRYDDKQQQCDASGGGSSECPASMSRLGDRIGEVASTNCLIDLFDGSLSQSEAG